MRVEDGESMQDFSKITEVITLNDLHREISKYIEHNKHSHSIYVPYAEKFLVIKNGVVVPIQIQCLTGSRYSAKKHGPIRQPKQK